MDRTTYLTLLRHARRRARRLPEAEDLLQDALLIALEARRGDLSRVENRRWLAGVMRNRALLDGRSSARRRRREAEFHAMAPGAGPPDAPSPPSVMTLPPALRTTALLALTGHTRAEIAWLQQLSDAALRKRISEIRRRWSGGDAGEADGDALRGDLPFGLMRRPCWGGCGINGRRWARMIRTGIFSWCRHEFRCGGNKVRPTAEKENAMFGKTRIGTICYYVKDPVRTEAFYRDVLGLEVVNMGDDGSGNDWLLANTAGGIELIFFKQDSRPGNTPIVVFDIADGGIDDIVTALAEKGATIVTPVSEAPGGWSAEFADPDGHVLSMYQAEDKPRARA